MAQSGCIIVTESNIILRMPIKDFYILLIRLFLGYIFFSSSLCKLSQGQFGQIIGRCNLEAELAPYGLALFAIAVSQLTSCLDILNIDAFEAEKTIANQYVFVITPNYNI